MTRLSKQEIATLKEMIKQINIRLPEAWQTEDWLKSGMDVIKSIKPAKVEKWDTIRKLFNEQARASNVIGYFESQGYKLIKTA